jgi:hypothetical protein
MSLSAHRSHEINCRKDALNPSGDLTGLRLRVSIYSSPLARHSCSQESIFATHPW